MPRWAIASVLALLAGACGYTQIQQSSLVPVPTMAPPAAPRGRADLFLGHSIVTYIGTRELRPNSDAGLWLPRHQLDGSLSVRLSRFFALRLMGGGGLPDDATAAAPTTLMNPGRSTWWVGTGMILTYRHESGVGVEVELDTSVLQVPSLLRWRDCDYWDECGPWRSTFQYDTVPMFAGTARVSHAPADWVVLFAGLTVRNHPTNRAAFRDLYASSSVTMGDPVLVVGLGAELTIEDVVSIIPHLAWPVAGGPVEYGPMVGLALRGRIGEGPGDALPPWSSRVFETERGEPSTPDVEQVPSPE